MIGAKELAHHGIAMASDNNKVLKFGIPKGSLEAQTLELMRRSGWRISVGERSYIPRVDDPALSCRLLRPQEMPRYIADGTLDAGITGSDWIVENGVDLIEVESFIYSKVTLQPTRWVLCVPENSPVRRLEDLSGKRVATEMVEFTRRIFTQRKIKVDVEFSWGVTEAKAADGLVDAVVEVTETGSSLRANGLRIVEELLTSSPVLVANHEAWADEWKQAKVRQIGVLVKGALDAVYPSPNLKGKEWVAVETVISEHTVRELFPKLLEAGAVGIIEYPLNKII